MRCIVFPFQLFSNCNLLERAAPVAKSLQSCPTLCDRVDSSPPGSSVSGMLQARILEWVAISFSRKVQRQRFFCVCASVGEYLD